MYNAVWCNIVIMFKSRHTYTHRNFLDVNIVVNKSYLIPKGYKLKISWFTKSGLFLGSDKIFIKKEQLKNWSRVC